MLNYIFITFDYYIDRDYKLNLWNFRNLRIGPDFNYNSLIYNNNSLIYNYNSLILEP